MNVFKIVAILVGLSVLASCGATGEKQDNAAVEENTANVDVNKLNLNNLVAEIKKKRKSIQIRGNCDKRKCSAAYGSIRCLFGAI